MSGLWGVISSLRDVSNVVGGEVGEVFEKGVGFKVDQGDRVPFCFNDWLGVGPLRILFPTVFRIASNKESSIKGRG